MFLSSGMKCFSWFSFCFSWNWMCLERELGGGFDFEHFPIYLGAISGPIPEGHWLMLLVVRSMPGSVAQFRLFWYYRNREFRLGF